jgi:hypothetical protein
MFLKYIRFNGLLAIADTSPPIIPLNRGSTVYKNYAINMAPLGVSIHDLVRENPQVVLYTVSLQFYYYQIQIVIDYNLSVSITIDGSGVSVEHRVNIAVVCHITSRGLLFTNICDTYSVSC